jgi:carbamoyl-phosphate synthase small subunit
MTYPHLGNYGVNEEDVESRQPFVRGFVMRECCQVPSNHRATMSLPDYLKRHNLLGIDGVDTRRITKLLRVKGAMRAAISTEILDGDVLLDQVVNSPAMTGADYVKDVTIDQPYAWKSLDTPAGTYRVTALDFGIKQNILRLLEAAGCAVTVLPSTANAEDILKTNPDGIFLSNGPGDPAALSYLTPVIQELVDSGKPVFGICLGHQVLATALGGKTFKLKFGHRGGNQPVLNNTTGKVEITSQNHGFAVDADSLNHDEIEITHVHLNDQTCSGLRHRSRPVFSVQYHPEASPGPHDSRYLFEQFTKLMDDTREKAAT